MRLAHSREPQSSCLGCRVYAHPAVVHKGLEAGEVGPPRGGQDGGRPALPRRPVPHAALLQRIQQRRPARARRWRLKPIGCGVWRV